MNVNIAIVEDNSDNIATLKYALSQTPYNIVIVDEAKNADEAFRALLNEKVELAFLDIQLRDSTIFSVLEKLFHEAKPFPELVFTTAHGSFENALKAIQFACLDFVTKPFSNEDIENAIQRYLLKKESRQHQQTEIGFLLQILRNDMQSPKTMAIQLHRGIIEIVDLVQIVYIEADENVSIIHLTNNQKLNSSKNFGHYLGLLADNKDFVQISKSCFVNLTHVKQYNHQDKSLKLKTNESLVVSFRFSKGLHKYLLNNQRDLISQSKFDFLKGFFKPKDGK